MSMRREIRILQHIAAAGLLVPASVDIGSPGGSIAATFTVDGVPAIIEGCGASDEEAADDVVRQLRVVLKRGEP